MAVGSEHPVSRPHLHNADPDEDTGGEGVQCAYGDEGGPVVAVELVQDADTDAHADGGDEGEERCEDALLLHGETDLDAVGGGG